ncbi:MAG: DUF3047 domain-containing protein [Deltaproteobacteria bacterium]|nr:DUF3047 domain-containing protein [Deltaproteobacteria bacterium]
MRALAPFRGPLGVILLLGTLALGGAAPRAAAAGQEERVGNFSAGDLAGWKTQEFQGQTRYDLVRGPHGKVLFAQSDGTAGGLYREVSVDLKVTPVLNWSWKVRNILEKGNAWTKEGDDFPARVYVIFDAFFPWNRTSICYVWANRLPKGEFTGNPFAPDNVKTLAVESGPALVGRWVTEARNVPEDYRRLFQEEPPPVRGVAVMTDTDQTGGEAEAWYGDISFSQ